MDPTALYDEIGVGSAATRQPDPRIARRRRTGEGQGVGRIERLGEPVHDDRAGLDQGRAGERVAAHQVAGMGDGETAEIGAPDRQRDHRFDDAGRAHRIEQRPAIGHAFEMNDDRLGAEKRCASTSNRNFEGRQGRGGRTHLVSPAMAAAAAIAGHFTDIRGEAS